MAFFVAREGVWDVEAGTVSGTPHLTVTDLRAGTHVKITVNFSARASLGSADEGFDFTVIAQGNNDVLAMTPTTGTFQGVEGWQSCVLSAVFEVLVTTDGETMFECVFDKGVLSGAGTIMNFVMVAEVI
jgi:hypothetical protein